MIVKELFAKLGLEVDKESFENGHNLLEGLKGGFGALALAAAAAVGALVEVARETAEAGEAAAIGAQKLGISTDAYQELSHAAYMAGVSQEGLETALFRMSRAAQEAKMGSTQAALAFQGLLSLRDLKTLKPDEQLEKLAQGFLSIKDQGQRAQKIMAIFGRGGAQLIPLLNKGSAGIKEFREQAHQLGVVQSEEQIKNDKELIELQREAAETLRGWRNEIGSEVIPKLIAFTKWVHEVGTSFNEWRKAHIDQIMTGIKLAGILLLSTLIAIAAVSIAANAATIGWFLALSVVALRTAVQTAIAWAIANLPLLLMIATIAIVLLWLEDLYQFLTGGESVIGDLVASWKADFNGFWDFLKQLMRWLVDVFFGDEVLAKIDDIAKALVEKLTAAWGKVKAFFQHPIDTVFGSSTPPPPPASAFGAGASGPGASVAGSPAGAGGSAKPAVNVNAPNHITINTHPGMSAEDIVGAQQKAIDEHHQKVNREALNAAG